MDETITKQMIIDALELCDCNTDGIVCERCPIKDEYYNGSWYDENGDCWIQLMHKAAELLSE